MREEEQKDGKNEQQTPPMDEKETLEDKLDEVLYRVQNAVYGERGSIDEDIPATMESPEGFRRPVGYATRRNLSKFLLKHLPKIVVGGFALLVLAVVIFILVRAF